MQRHLTNIAISNERTQPWFTDFIEQIESETSLKWETDIELPTLTAIRDLLLAASSKDPPEGVGQFNNSRYVYFNKNILSPFFTRARTSVQNLTPWMIFLHGDIYIILKHRNVNNFASIRFFQLLNKNIFNGTLKIPNRMLADFYIPTL